MSSPAWIPFLADGESQESPSKELGALEARLGRLLAGCDYHHQRGAQARLSAPFPHPYTPQAAVI